MPVDLRTVDPEQFDQWSAAVDEAFGRDVDTEELRHRRAVLELDRTLAALDGPDVVATASALSRDLTVPGAVLPAAYVTKVAVLPTHHRQGLLGRMMRRQLDDVHQRGEPVAALEASESGIYRRYGYGSAAERVRFRIERSFTSLASEPRVHGRLRRVSREEALKVWPDVYDRVGRQQPGALARSAAWWRHRQLPEPRRGPGEQSAGRYVVYEERGQAEGYLQYGVSARWEAGLPAGELTVDELLATGRPAHAALWRYAFGVDLVTGISGAGRPVDEPLLWMLADPRRLHRTQADGLWLRVVDVPVALAGRRYALGGRIVLGVRDTFCPWNDGRFLLEGGPDGAAARRTVQEPDIVLDAADLAAAYLGGTTFSILSRAGRAEGDAQALREADLMFSWDPRPWSP